VRHIKYKEDNNLENQNPINKGYMFYDETVMKLNEMNKMPKDESDRD